MVVLWILHKLRSSQPSDRHEYHRGRGMFHDMVLTVLSFDFVGIARRRDTRYAQLVLQIPYHRTHSSASDKLHAFVTVIVCY